MILLCFLAYMLYTTACRLTTSRATFASFIRAATAAPSVSSLWALKSCFVLLSTYLHDTIVNECWAIRWKAARTRRTFSAGAEYLLCLQVDSGLLSDVVVWEFGPCGTVLKLDFWGSLRYDKVYRFGWLIAIEQQRSHRIAIVICICS